MPALRGLPSDDTSTRISKTLAYLLRHGAQKQGLYMRKDGWVRVQDLLSRPEFKDVSFQHLHHLVVSNAKQRFVLMYGSDPTIRPTQTSKGKAKPASTNDNIDELPIEVVSPQPEISPYDPNQPLASTSASASDANDQTKPSWFIRASQGHSLPVTTEHLTSITKDENAESEVVGEMIHGTKWENWEAIRDTGLSPMTRLHIHLSPSLSHPTVRPNSTLLIYLSLPLLLDAGIPVFVSDNGVVLTPGDQTGRVGSAFFAKVIRRRKEFVDPEPVDAEALAPAEEDAQDLERRLRAAGLGDAVGSEGQAGQKQKKNRKGKAPLKVKKEWDEVVWENGKEIVPSRLL